MKRLALLLLSPISAFALLGDTIDSPHLKVETEIVTDTDAVTTLNTFIEIQEGKLGEYKRLRELFLNLKQYEASFILNPTDAKLAAQLVHSAREALSLMQENHLEYLFSSNVLKDLRFYSSIAGKHKP